VLARWERAERSVRDLPDEAHAGLQRRAAANGRSIQQYLTVELTRLAKTPSMAEVLDRVGRRGLGLDEALDDVADERRHR
jgi:plasmid stability protein